MIISDSWLGTQYGVGFVKYLADNFKIVAIIDLAESLRGSIDRDVYYSPRKDL
jgi:hypothetical protein